MFTLVDPSTIESILRTSTSELTSTSSFSLNILTTELTPTSDPTLNSTTIKPTMANNGGKISLICIALLFLIEPSN